MRLNPFADFLNGGERFGELNIYTKRSDDGCELSSSGDFDMLAIRGTIDQSLEFSFSLGKSNGPHEFYSPKRLYLVQNC